LNPPTPFKNFKTSTNHKREREDSHEQEIFLAATHVYWKE